MASTAGLWAWLGERLADLRAAAYTSPARDRRQQPTRVIAELGIRPGSRVADLGSGGGYFTVHLARAVGPDGVVYAVDTDEALLRRIERLALDQGLAGIRTVTADEHGPSLPERVDLIFCSNVFHHLSNQERYFADAARCLLPGGAVAIVEARVEGLVDRIVGHGTPAEQIRETMERAGYRRTQNHHFLGRHSFQVFRTVP
jgi:arsenite methyltransferase